MIDINWNMFNLKNADKRTAFENMCRHLFCRNLSISGYDLQANFNNPGLEAKPVLRNGKYYGFQCKYIEPTTSSSTLYREIRKSLDVAYETYIGTLDTIYIYTNAKIKPNVTKQQLEDPKNKSDRFQIQRTADKNNIEIKWITEDSLEILINDPKNNDIAVFYFSEGRELSFLDSSISIKDKTFLNSEEFISLPLKDYKGYDDIMAGLDKGCCSIVLGDAGSGKTLMMKKLFSRYKDKFLGDYTKTIKEPVVFPIFIRLRECINGNVEDILRQRLRDYRIDKTTNTFRYLYFFDGLDEVSVSFIDNILSYAQTIKSNDNTHGIIFSSRKDSFNLAFLYRYFSEIEKIEILPLSSEHIEDYFKSKNDEKKIKNFQELRIKNKSLISDLEDIFSISLLWEMVDKVDETTTKIDLCEESANYFLKNYKKLSEINLPEPKTQHIKDLFKDIAYHMRKSNLLNINISEIHALIQGKFDRLTYNDINKIIYCFSELFFEKADSQNQMIFSFRHRRFQEYFLCMKVLEVFPKYPCVLRELNLLSEKDFILRLFLKYGLRESFANKDILQNLILRFFEAYLGSNYWAGYEDSYIGIRSDYGVGGVNPYEQDEFINALTNQTKENIFLLFDKLDIKKINLSNPQVFSELIVLFHKKTGINIFEDIINEFYYKDEELAKIKFKSLYDELYFNKFIKKEDLCLNTYYDSIKNLKIIPNTDFVSVADKDSQYALSFYKFAIDYDILFLCTIIHEIEIGHLELLCYELLRNENISLIVLEKAESNNLKDSIVSRVEISDKDIFMLNTIVYYNLVTHKDYCKETLKIRLDKVNQNNLPTWNRNIEANQYIAILFKENETIYTPNYKLGIEIKNIALSSDPLDNILNEIVFAVQQYNFSNYNWFKYNNSNLIGTILATYPFEINDIKKTLYRLFKYDSVVSMLTIYYSILNIDTNLFKQIANESILNSIYEKSRNQLSYYDDNSNIEYMFASMYAYFNIDKSHQLLIKGLNNSICRPAFRKENLIKYTLPNLIKLFAINNWYTEEELEDFSLKIFDMLRIMSDTTDRGADLSFFKEVLLEIMPLSSLLNDEQIYNTKVENNKKIDNSKFKEINLQKSNLTMESLVDYYECRIDGVDYSSIEVWDSLINFELENYGKLNKLFTVLENNNYPEPYWSEVNECFPMITAILLENPKTKQKMMDFILSQGGRSGLINMIETSIINSDIHNGKRYFDALLLLCEMIVYPMNSGFLKAENRIDLVSDIISIVENSISDDWFINQDYDRIFRANPNIKIVTCEFEERNSYYEEWATGHPDSNAYLYEYSLYYNSSLIKRYNLVSVDGGRATLPIPRLGTNIITRKDYRIALIINEGEVLEYIHRSGLVVE